MPFTRGFGPLELVIILVIVLIIFGVGRLSEIGGAMGKAIREFRKAQTGEGDQDTSATPDEETPVGTNGPSRH